MEFKQENQKWGTDDITGKTGKLKAEPAPAAILPGSDLEGYTLSALRSAAQGGNTQAQAELSRRYLNGVGGAIANAATAKEWAQRGADAGDPLCSASLAVCQYNLKEYQASLDASELALTQCLPMDQPVDSILNALLNISSISAKAQAKLAASAFGKQERRLRDNLAKARSELDNAMAYQRHATVGLPQLLWGLLFIAAAAAVFFLWHPAAQADFHPDEDIYMIIGVVIAIIGWILLQSFWGGIICGVIVALILTYGLEPLVNLPNFLPILRLAAVALCGIIGLIKAFKGASKQAAYRAFMARSSKAQSQLMQLQAKVSACYTELIDYFEKRYALMARIMEIMPDSIRQELGDSFVTYANRHLNEGQALSKEYASWRSESKRPA